MIDIPKNNETLSEKTLADRVFASHKEFLKLAPQYDRKVWDPRVAVKEHRGSCMAELLFVASGLIAEGEISEDDIKVGFSKNHGTSQVVDLIGTTGKLYAHSFMLLSAGNGVILEADFRANRADEAPRIQRLLPDELESDKLYISALSNAIKHYAEIDNQTGPTVNELVDLYLNYSDKGNSASVRNADSEAVRFDQDF